MTFLFGIIVGVLVCELELLTSLKTFLVDSGFVELLIAKLEMI